MTEYQIRRLTMSSHETPVAAHRKPVLITVSCLAEGAHRPRRQTRAVAPRADGPAGSKGAADCAAGGMKKPPSIGRRHLGILSQLMNEQMTYWGHFILYSELSVSNNSPSHNKANNSKAITVKSYS